MFSIDEDTCARSRASGAMIVSESTASCSSWSFWRASSRSTSSTSRSAGLARRITSLRSSPRPARPTPSSLRMIDRRSRSGSRMMLLSRSRSTDFSVFSTGSRHWPSPGALVDLPQLARAARRRPRASASARTRRTSRRSATAAGRCSARRRGSPGSRGRRSCSTTAALKSVGHLDVVDRADLDAGDLDVLAGDDEAGVVEDRAHAVGVVLLAR